MNRVSHAVAESCSCVCIGCSRSYDSTPKSPDPKGGHNMSENVKKPSLRQIKVRGPARTHKKHCNPL